MDLGRSWAPFGKGLGGSGTSLGRSWASFGRFVALQNRIVLKHWPKMVPETPLGSIWGRFWKGLGKVFGWFGEGLRKIWARFQQFRMNVSSM